MYSHESVSFSAQQKQRFSRRLNHSVHYNIYVFLIAKPYTTVEIKNAFTTIFSEHDALRLNYLFDSELALIQQKVLPAPDISFKIEGENEEIEMDRSTIHFKMMEIKKRLDTECSGAAKYLVNIRGREKKWIFIGVPDLSADFISAKNILNQLQMLLGNNGSALDVFADEHIQYIDYIKFRAFSEIVSSNSNTPPVFCSWRRTSDFT